MPTNHSLDDAEDQLYNTASDVDDLRPGVSESKYWLLLGGESSSRSLSEKNCIAVKPGLEPIIKSWTLLSHFLLLALTCTLLWLNLSKMFAFEDDFAASTGDGRDGSSLSSMFSSANKLGALQFVAKAHELLIIFSLAQMILLFTKRSLVKADQGIPLGILSYGFVNPSFSALFESSLWSGWESATLFTSFVILCTFIAGLAAPSSAVLMIPTKNWWPVPTPTSPDISPLYIRGHNTYNHPLSVTTASPECMDGSATTFCPGGDAAELLVWAAAFPSTGIRSNISLTEGLGRAKRMISAFELKPEKWSNGSTILAITLDANTILLHGLLANYVRGRDAGKISEVKDARYSLRNAASAPLVQVSCEGQDYLSARNTSLAVAEHHNHHAPRITSKGMICFNTSQSDCGKQDVRSQVIAGDLGRNIWNYSRPISAVNFTWLDLNTTTSSFSLAAIATVPYLKPAAGTGIAPIGSVLISCAIDARWTPATAFYEPNRSELIESNISSIQKSLRNSPGTVIQASKPIKIAASWAESLNLPYNLSGHTLPFMELLIRTRQQNWTISETTGGPGNDTQSIYVNVEARDPEDVFRNMSRMVATQIGMVLANGLSRARYGVDIKYTNSSASGESSIRLQSLIYQKGPRHDLDLEQNLVLSPEILAENFTRIEVVFEQAGYGWGVRTVTWWIGLVVLLLHTILVIGFIAFRFASYIIGGEKGEVVAWRTIPELLTLALQSTPSPVLPGSGLGIDLRQWQLPVKVRETSETKLELVVGTERGGLNKVYVGRKYH